MKKNIIKSVALVAVVSGALFCCGCNNANLNMQLSKATSECGKHTGVILYSGASFQVVRVEIEGINYLCNTKGGIIRESSSITPQ